MRTAAEALAIELQVLQFANLGASPDNGVDALAMLSSPITRNASMQLAEYTRPTRLPAISPFAPFAEFGGLMAYGTRSDGLLSALCRVRQQVTRWCDGS